LLDGFISQVAEENQVRHYSEPEQIAEVVYQAATDDTDQLRYLAGDDAKAIHAARLQLGDEQFRRSIAQQFFGNA
jgi:hypothetical protein